MPTCIRLSDKINVNKWPGILKLHLLSSNPKVLNIHRLLKNEHIGNTILHDSFVLFYNKKKNAVIWGAAMIIFHLVYL